MLFVISRKNFKLVKRKNCHTNTKAIINKPKLSISFTLAENGSRAELIGTLMGQ